MRRCEVCCRIGGDEFAVILANTSGEGARVLAQDLEDLVARVKVQVKRGVDLEISASAGWAELGSGMDARGILQAAGEALEKRKAAPHKTSVSA